MSSWIVWLLGPVCLLTTTLGDLASDKQGPFDISLKYVENCFLEEATDLFKIYPKVKKLTRTGVVVEGNMTLNVTFDNNIKVKINFGKSTPQGWKDNFMVTDFKGKGWCDVINEYVGPEDLAKIFARVISDTKNYTGCPLGAGIFKLNDIELRVEEFKGVPIFPFGKYRTTTHFFLNDFDSPPIGCLVIYMDFVPKIINKKKKG